MLRDLGRALSQAMSESSDVNQALRRIHEEGYGLIILLDRRSDRASDRAEGEGPRAERAIPAPASPRKSLPGAVRGPTGAPPGFRIDGADLAFLRSIGIDPTRRVHGRPRRSRRPPSGPGSPPDASDSPDRS